MLGRLFNLNGSLAVRVDGLENALETVVSTTTKMYM